ncbi:MAG: Maf family protein [Gaiellaceae bacterium]
MSEAPTLLLASVSPQRRAILAQLGIPFRDAAPHYVEHDPADADPVALVRAHAEGKARSLAHEARGRPVLGVDTTVVLDGRIYGKASDEREAAAMLADLSGRTHEVLSGLCLVGVDWRELEHEVTRVTFAALGERRIAAYVATGEWRARAGAYAIQGRGAGLVERIEGDYLNVVGLPAALLLRLLRERFPDSFGL